MTKQQTSTKLKKMSSSKKKALRLLILQDHKCMICGERVKPEEANLHHFIPQSHGGHLTSIYNLTATHLVCNQKKGNDYPSPLEWLRFAKATEQKFHRDIDTLNILEHFPSLRD